MAEFKEELVINALHADKAEVGKKYWFADSIINLKARIDEDDIESSIGILTQIDTNRFHAFRYRNTFWEFIYPYYEEPPKQRMTYRQLSEWLVKGNGFFKYKNATAYCYVFVSPLESELNDEVAENIVIRPWDSEEWQEPTADIYERDCKGGKK